MMKLVKLIPLLLLVLLLAAGAGLAWLLGTTSGARWLLSAAAGGGGATIHTRQVEGRLWDRLQMQGVIINLPGRRIEVDRLDLRWKPFLLLAGTIGVRDLSLSGVRIQDDTPPSAAPPDLSWPRLPDSLGLLDLTIARLGVTSLNYRRGQGSIVKVERFDGSLAWEDMQLALTRVSLVSSAGSLTGALTAGMRRPSFSADLVFVPPRGSDGVRSVAFTSQLRPGSGNEHVAGPFTVILRGTVKGVERRLDLAGVAGMTRTGFNLRDLRLAMGGVGGSISGAGSFDLKSQEPRFSLSLAAAGLDLQKLAGQRTALSGTMRLSGTRQKYRGDFDLVNRGIAWRAAGLKGDFIGTRSGLNFERLLGTMLGGSLRGNAALDWSKGLAMSSELTARGMDPARMAREWPGVLNLDLSLRMTRPEAGTASGALDAVIRESRLHGQPLTGRLQAGFRGDAVLVERLDLQGSGFRIHADGDPARRLNVAFKATDLSRLVAGSSGAVDAGGWVSWRDGRAAGDVAVAGKGVALGGGAAAGSVKLLVHLDREGARKVRATVAARRVTFGSFGADVLQAGLEGTVVQHTITAAVRADGADARMALEGGLHDGTWAGNLTSLSGNDGFGPWQLRRPASLKVGLRDGTISPIAIASARGEELEAQASYSRAPLQGTMRSNWSSVNLARANPWLQDIRLTGASSGSIDLVLHQGTLKSLSSRVSLAGTISSGGHTTGLRRGELQLAAGGKGIAGNLLVQLERGGELQGTFASPVMPGRGVPEQGTVSFTLRDLDLAQLEPWFPETAAVRGRLTGAASGRLLPGQRFELEGNLSLAGGSIAVQRPDGEMSAVLRTAETRWKWRDRTLEGTAALVFSEGGELKGRFSLPLGASWPVAVRQDGPLAVALNGKFQEKGMLPALFPEAVQESAADLDLNLTVAGTWKEPRPSGTIRLSKGGAYLPSAGIRISDLQVTAGLEKGLVRIDPFRARSGSGTVEGTALVRLDGVRPVSYSATLNGNHFQLVHFPELHVEVSPRLTMEGTPHRLAVRGEVLLPEFRITGPPAKGPVGPSEDVILEGRRTPSRAEPQFDLDVQVRCVLGDRVLVKLEGIDAQLGGSMELVLRSLDRITSRGEIRVVKGRYQTYGVNLDIARGRVFYAGGPITRPTLDILALRTVGDVKAGVTVGGTIRAPVVRLYSEPSMPDVDILSYVVLGHPLGSGSGEQVDLMTRAAGVLLSTGQSAMLQDQIKSRLGLSTLEITTAGRESGHMGYRPIQSAPPGSAQAQQQTGITQAMLTVGKYLTPRLYVSYGRSIFTESNLFLMRYDIFKNWQIETQTGTESGVDLYYKIEFK